MAKANTPKIVISDLWMDFPDPRRSKQAPKDKTKSRAKSAVPVLERVNLTVNEGEFVCIVGPSGCGKSTLLNIVGGFLKATRGQVTIDGAPVQGPDLKRIFIFQENGVFPWLTVEDNVGFGLLGEEAEVRRRNVAHYIEMVGLTGFEKSYPRELSGGMRQRVEIARALAANPDVLYMDEPFGALDFLTRLRMRAELVEIWQREKKTVLFVTHDVEESVQLADRVVVMSRRPATIANLVEVNLPRPRDLDAPEYLSIRDEIFETMGLDHSGISSAQNVGQPASPTPAPTKAAVPMRSKKLDADVIVVGGGPAGAALGAYLGRAGIDHLILDKAHHPRAHVGESLSSTATRLLREIDFLPTLEREGFGVKRGISWTTWDGADSIDMTLAGDGRDELAYHVDRSKFDELLLRHARNNGSRILSGAHVDRVEFNRQGFATGISAKVSESRFTLNARLVVDASGRHCLLGRQLRLVNSHSKSQRFAIHSWFTNIALGKDSTADYTHIHLLPGQLGWAWQIPITGEVTSVGVVTDREPDMKSGGDVDQLFKHAVEHNPVLAGRMDNAVRLREYRIDANFGYDMGRTAGNGWLMVGDAAFFIDPIFPAGVSNALHTAKLAAEAIAAGFANNDLGEDAFAGYERRLRDGIGIWSQLVTLIYGDPSALIAAATESEHRDRFLRLFEGEVYEPAAAEAMEQLRRAVGADADTLAAPSGSAAQ
ncbi:MAG TPA: ATP-binding cassette domain-containing protein [Pyrinomonadaceae bacterium]|nr:ATP-binding cassette domain-containing protein [Pyrinomonadaceae bacterium]